MKIFSTFTGIGGFEVGIQNAWLRTKGERNSAEAPARDTQGQPGQRTELGLQGLDVVGYSEIDKHAIKVYERHFPNVKNYGDITKINAKELPDFDCLVGGFPCQAFSIAGKRRGFEDTRGTLFFDLARILREKQPRYFVFENVKGLVSHDQGNTFRTIITTIDELGYDCQWSVLNSKNHGVPQNRERIIIVGHLRVTPRPQVFPIGGSLRENLEPNQERTSDIFPTIRATHYKSGDNQPVIRQVNNPVHSNNRAYDASGISPALNTMQGGNRQPKVLAKTIRTGGRSSPHGSKQNWDSYEVNGTIRRLTPLECERLQAFEDNWTKYGVESDGTTVEISDTQRYKMCGNAVTTNVIRAVFERIFNTPHPA